MIRGPENPALGQRVRHLVLLYYHLLLKYFDGKQPPRALLPAQDDLPERALAQHLEELEVFQRHLPLSARLDVRGALPRELLAQVFHRALRRHVDVLALRRQALRYHFYRCHPLLPENVKVVRPRGRGNCRAETFRILCRR